MGKTSRKTALWQNFELPQNLQKRFQADIMNKVDKKAHHKGGVLGFIPLESREIRLYACELLTLELITKYRPESCPVTGSDSWLDLNRKRLQETLTEMITIWVEEKREKERSKDPTYHSGGHSKLTAKKSPSIIGYLKTNKSISTMDKELGYKSFNETVDPRIALSPVHRPAPEGIRTSNDDEDDIVRPRRGNSEESSDIPFAEDEELPELSHILTSPIGRERAYPADPDISSMLPKQPIRYGDISSPEEPRGIPATMGAENIPAILPATVQLPITPLYSRKRNRTRDQYSIPSSDSEDSESSTPGTKRRGIERMEAIEHSRARGESEITVRNVSQSFDGLFRGIPEETVREVTQTAASMTGATVGTPTVMVDDEQDAPVPAHRTAPSLGESLLEYFQTCRDSVLEAANRSPSSNEQCKQFHHDAALLDHVCTDIRSRILAWNEENEPSLGSNQVTSFTLYR